ncbi:hypothetical protein [Streptomyces sp. NPDC047009]|uniref:hypothetical protein n=1 Tax=Streptomyces sp. NPDC047009 TaxID=3154496 RepID=UPI0033CDD298
MQRTDESGRSYGEDPYGGIGHADAYGYEHGGSATTDTATTPRDLEQLAQRTTPMHEDVSAEGTDPYTTRPNLYVIATDPYAAGPHPATAGWDAPHGDVLTVPPPELDPSGPPAPEPGAPKSESVRPVFVDSSGRRQRRVLRAARLLVIPAGGYVALLISALLGGPTLNAPFVPQPDSPHTPRATAPDASSGTDHSARNESPAAAQTNSRPTPTQKAPGSTDGSAAPATSAAAAPGPTAASTGVASPTSTPTASATATATTNPHSKGRAVGSSHNPVK